MSELEPGEFRVSDAERESALDALGKHLTSGRLDVDEYGDRTAKVSVAKKRSELSEVFQDLPEPRPRFDAIPGAEPPARQQPQPIAPRSHRPQDRAVLALVPLFAIIALVLAVTATRSFLPVFLLPMAFICVGHMMHRGRRHHGWPHR